MTLFTGTAFFVVLEVAFVAGIAVTGKGNTKENQAFKYTLYSTAVICCWLMWALMYMAQMHPLVRPILQ